MICPVSAIPLWYQNLLYQLPGLVQARAAFLAWALGSWRRRRLAIGTASPAAASVFVGGCTRQASRQVAKRFLLDSPADARLSGKAPSRACKSSKDWPRHPIPLTNLGSSSQSFGY